MRCYMKELKLNEFLDRADDFINNASIGEEFYAVETNSGKAIVISEDEWKMLTDAMRVAMGCNPKHCDSSLIKPRIFCLIVLVSFDVSFRLLPERLSTVPAIIKSLSVQSSYCEKIANHRNKCGGLSC